MAVVKDKETIKAVDLLSLLIMKSKWPLAYEVMSRYKKRFEIIIKACDNNYDDDIPSELKSNTAIKDELKDVCIFFSSIIGENFPIELYLDYIG